MNNYLKKIILIVGISSAVFTQSSAQNVELATAALRIPCSILEYELRNSSSRGASFVKALIHANRLVNEMCAKPPCRWLYILDSDALLQAPLSQTFATSLIFYDALGIIKNLAEVIVGPSDKKEPAEKADQFQDLLGYIVFPLLESAAALGRVKGNSIDVKTLAFKYSNSLIILSRLGQFYCCAPQTSLKRKIYAVLVLICVIDLVIKAQKPASYWDALVDSAAPRVNAAYSHGQTFLRFLNAPDAFRNDDNVKFVECAKELLRSNSWSELWQKLRGTAGQS